MDRDEYWEECVAIAASECGAVLTPDQVAYIGGACAGAHENYGMAFYSPPAGEHLRTEIEKLKREVRSERDKVHCVECNGRGRIVTHGPYHSSDSQCWKCRGDGRHAP